MEDVNDTAIEASGLTKTYGDRTVVDIDHLSIRRGEVFGLLGPNGAGKTTFVEMCEGYRRPTSGHLSVLGTDPTSGGSSWRSRLGIVTQETGAFDRLTVAEAVGHLAGFYPNPRSVAEALAMTDLVELADRLVDHLSGGQRRRLDLACGIVGRPELLFLDEPTTGLDPEVRRRLWSMIDGLRDAGTTIVLTTHYLDEAEQLADRVGVVAAGALIALDTPDRLGGHDANTTVVSFRPSAQTETLLATQEWERIDHDRVGIRSTQPAALVAELHRLGGEIDGLEVVRPSLEDAYLRLIEDHTAAFGQRHANEPTSYEARTNHSRTTEQRTDDSQEIAS
ncbi:MAG: ABC transporter ATP-binding protein [Ilumatobacter sp.]|uniref:ABC transporter ATP-binding protein n=1 Tax=Ilumatobacter sp. TaxID=1967498 RepID=UPI00391B22DE